ncbi:MAG: DUF134 domain-containing protein [Methanospirillum sp.]|uniref:DUF134 domain-containing protein n=1 Tax=Methanospirillum sp. TaxID=45200 RepID=UPI002370361C|nr:DUF134 domain-containing protein [Methanospirillum sp.]MDD1729007.1 DUF134 domain-containing protein [Methanospirillum sp.]
MIPEENPEENPCKTRGRPRIRRRIGEHGPWRCYAPQCNTGEDLGSVSLLPEEIELMRLIDLEGMEQEEAAVVLGVSRKTVWKDIHEVRMKVADALVHGKIIEVRDCTIRSEGSCPKENEDICPKKLGARCIRRESDDCPDPCHHN